jgi:anti-sigma B factor antagonist
VKIGFRSDGGVGVFTLEGRLDLESAPELRREFLERSRAGDLVRFAFDLGGVPAVDSSGIGALLACLKEASRRGGDVKLARLQPGVRLVLEITKVHRVFGVYDDPLAAAASFARPRSGA